MRPNQSVTLLIYIGLCCHSVSQSVSQSVTIAPTLNRIPKCKEIAGKPTHLPVGNLRITLRSC